MGEAEALMDELRHGVRAVTVAGVVALLVLLFPLALSPGPGNVSFAGIGATPVVIDPKRVEIMMGRLNARGELVLEQLD